MHTTFYKRKADTNLRSVIWFLLNYYRIRATKSTIDTLLGKHMEYPSLLSVKDTLSEYGIESVAIRKGEYRYTDFETPFICAIQQENWIAPSFSVVTEADSETITFLDPIIDKLRTISATAFEQLDKEIILLLDGAAGKDEEYYTANRKKEQTEWYFQQTPIFLFILVLMVTTAHAILSPTVNHWINVAFLLSSVVGLGTSLLLLWHEVDAQNPFIKDVCGGFGKRASCDAVLASDGASLFGISWSVWGFSYFSTFFLSQVLFLNQPTYAFLWSSVSILTAPYIGFSIYYQWKVVKRWCPLCLGIQGVLLLNVLLSLTFLSATSFPPLVSWYTVFTVVALGSGLLLLTHYAVPLIRTARNSRNYEKRWKKLHFHPDIFRAALVKGNQVTIPRQDLGIVIGNPKATHEIIKVCNPYCGPCAKAHPILEDVVKSNANVRVRIVFRTSGGDDDPARLPVQHFLAIQEKFGTEEVKRALESWYSAKTKDYEAFSKKFPMNGELESQRGKIFEMKEWCNEFKVRATPTLFIDGYEYPNEYMIKELKHLF